MSNEFRNIRKEMEDAYKKEQTQKSLQEKQQREAQQRREEEKKQLQAQALRRIEEARNLGLRLGIRGLLEGVKQQVWGGKGEISENQLIYPNHPFDSEPYKYWRYGHYLIHLSSRKFSHPSYSTEQGWSSSGGSSTRGVVFDAVCVEFSGETKNPFDATEVSVSDTRTLLFSPSGDISEREVRRNLYQSRARGPVEGFGRGNFSVAGVIQSQIKDVLKASCLARGYEKLPK